MVVTLASYGQASYETEYNSGIGCNGLTSARHDLLHKQYATKYPETVNPSVDEQFIFNGPFAVTDAVGAGKDLGKLLLSPTRTFAPVIAKVLKLHSNKITGIIHNTGGGASKCLHYIPNNVQVVKNNFLPAPLIFELIQKTVNTSWQEMYKVFNMGNRLEIYTDAETATEIIAIANSFNIEAQILGEVQAAATKKVIMQTQYGNWEYE